MPRARPPIRHNVGVITVFIATLAALLPITNPLGAVAAFAGLTSRFDARTQHAQAWRTGLYVGGILVVFTAIGTVLLSVLGISLAALQIAGGLVVMHAGFGMIVPRVVATPDEQAEAQTKADISFSPMALPLVAGPGAIGVVIGLAARNPAVLDRVAIAAASVVIAVVVALVLRYGTPLVDKLGPTGIGALTRVMGFLILAIGVELAIHGVLAAVPPL
jgi:multiple antibiotic resistance protein